MRIKRQSLYYLFLSLFIMVSNTINAYDFYCDGLYYEKMRNGKNEVFVTYEKSSETTTYVGDIIIPASVTYDGITYDVVAIGDRAFAWNKISSIDIPNTVLTIGSGAFLSTELSSINIPSSVTSIGYEAFLGCTYLHSVSLPEGITQIEYSTFQGCSNLNNISIPNNVSSIGHSAFRNCEKLTSLTIPNNVSSIGYWAFENCGLKSISFPEKITELEMAVLSECKNLESVSFLGSITKIGDKAFSSCTKLNDIIIPESVTSIGELAFSGCGIKSITIPNSVISIGQQAFYYCKKLTLVNSEILAPFDIDESVFWEINSSVTLQVPRGTSNRYITCNWTKYFASVVETGAKNLTLSSIGSGVVTFNEVTVRNETKTIYIDEGTSVTISFTPDNGFQIKSLKIDGTNITATSGYTFSIIADTSIEVEFEAKPPTKYSLSITATGKGIASYNGETIREATKNYSLDEGISTTITFTPDDGYRIKSLKINEEPVTASTKYTVTITSNTTIEVEFEAIPPMTYTLSISATGNGSASYGGESIRGTTKNYTVNEGTSATITFTPDDGYRIKSLKVDGSAVTACTSYTVTVNANTTIEVEFEAIPVTPSNYSLSITVSGNGAVSYGGETIRGTTKIYTATEGTSATITITPDNGYQIKSLKVNGSSVSATNSYSVTINSDTTIEVEFEEIPETPDTPDTPTLYTLSIKVNGNGYVEYNGETIRDAIQSYSVNEGDDVSLTLTPESGNHVGSVIINGTSVVASGSYTISNIQEDTSVEVYYEETSESSVITINGVNYQIVSQDEHMLLLDVGDYGITLEVPEKVEFQGEEWTINGITGNALDNSEDLAAIIWNPQIPFTAKVSNPNLLLYVKDEAYAPASIRNVVVNGFAKTITLSDAQSGNNFYCPSTFTTQSIIYTHNYSMKTGLNESKGWETIALPFDVQQISHSSKGDIVPFAKWTSEDATKPFWLFELTGYGFIEADGIKANTPYIISMPNNEIYPSDYQLSGRVTFSALNAEVKKSDDIQTATFGNNTFVPAFTNYNAESGYYVLNVNNDFETYQGSANVGSKFILNLRRIHPFEAYMTSTSGTRSIDIFDGMTTSIRDVLDITDSQKTQKVYDLSGRLIMTGTSLESIRQELPAGVYIINNKKMIIK